MDRERLKEVHQTDLTESRINQDFLDWLKTSGVTYLLVLMLALCAYLFYVRWSQSRHNYTSEAWTALNDAKMPLSYEEVATQYADVDAVAQLAHLRAAEIWMEGVYAGRTIDTTPEPVTPVGVDPNDPTAPPKPADQGVPMTDADRQDYLQKADRLFEKVIAADDKSQGMALLVSKALCGRAAVAESTGKADEAKGFYEQAAARVEGIYPQLAEIARKRAESVSADAAPVVLPTESELIASQKPQAPMDPAALDPMLREIIMPEDDAENDG
jgi:hypothetical protein